MESWNSPIDESESPSQGKIAHPQLIKRDGESLEDFEDITKDEPSMKDLTAEFLQFETGDRSKHQQEESVFKDDVHFGFEPKSNDILDSNTDIKMSEGFEKGNENSPILEKSNSSHILDQDDFEQNHFQPNSDDFLGPSGGHSGLITVDETKLIDIGSNDDISTGSDDLSFIPKKGESSPVLQSDLDKDIIKAAVERKSSETADLSFNTQPLSKFTSDSGMTMSHSGDGLHVRKNADNDASDDDDVAPEPIPKDYPEIGALEGKQFLAAMGLDSWFHPDLLHPKVESLIYWRDPKKSGIVFGAILIILLSLTSFSLISVVAYTSLIALIGTLAFRIYKSVMQAVQKTSEGHPFKQYLVAVLEHPIITAVFNSIEEYLDIDLTLNPEKAREIADVTVTHINKTLNEVRRLFLIEDVFDSIKFGILLWGLTYLGAWFNGLSLLIIAFVGLFTLPKVYENNKTQIDTNVDFVKSKLNEYTEKITAVIPLGKKTEEVKDKGE